ncbi:toll-like receptor 3 [Patella vulgata]|uniref:toll-like receptor 3 n=1 Tax=Patella vulgata TaxID=6465 RepID=UPI00217F6741|nr:toll-like receptor 3 [Patella vulgata]
MMLVIVILVFCLQSVNGQDACSTGLCQCTRLTARCYNKNLTYIPKFPRNITTINLTNNSFRDIGPTTFLNISNTSIVNIILSHNEIHTIRENVLQNLSHVHSLDLSDNLLTSDSLRNLFSSVQNDSQLSKISLKKNRLQAIPFDVFDDFKSQDRILMDLSNNKIEEFNISTFRSIKNLGELNLGYNNISKMVTAVITQLEYISINNNNFDSLSDFCVPQTSFPNLQKIQVQGNRIGNFIPEHLNCIKNLEYLDLSQNAIVSLKTDSFHSFKSLIWLSIEAQRSPDSLIIQERAFNNSNIVTLMLSRNRLSIKHLDEHAFDGCDNIRKLHLSKNYFFTNEEKLNVALAPLKTLKKLDLNGCGLRIIPNVVAKHFHDLRYLYIRLNKIKSWPDNFFKNNIDLQELDVSDNLIQTITNKMLSKMLRERLKFISLGNNPFVCNCELVWLIQWIHRAPDKFFNYPLGYRCLNITEKICLNNTGVFISVTTVACFFIFVIFIISVIFIYIWDIKYHIYMWRYKPRELLDIAEKHFVYDVFVAYCVEDSDWVLGSLLPVMEEGENIKLCIHERDFQGGGLDNIVQHMENSRKVLVFLSNDFARSKLCQFEMSLAQKLIIDMSIESIVVVLLENIATVNMSKSLDALLKTTTYISWDDEDEEDVFWHKIKTSLNRPYEL